MSMLFILDNQRDNAVIRANSKLKPFLKVQLPHSVMVNGKVEQYSPDHPYSGMDLEELEALNIREGQPGGAIDPNKVMKQPDPEWSPYDAELRKFGDNAQGTAKPTSSALQTILYDPRANIVHYNFRNGTKTYHSIMSNNLFNQWITAPSIGKFWNKYLRTSGKGGLPRANGVSSFKLPSAGAPTDGMPTPSTPAAPSNLRPTGGNAMGGTGNYTRPVGNLGGKSMLPTLSTFDLIRMLITKAK